MRGRGTAERLVTCAVISAIVLGIEGRYIAAEEPAGACARAEATREQGVENPRLKHRVAPKYPARARRERLAASVTLCARVETDGSVSVLEVVSCTNEGHGFEAAAREALKKWRYAPGTKNGKPVPVLFTVVIEFLLN